jgi:hypothetical protein
MGGALMLRLESVDPGPVALVEGADDDRRRRVALAAAEFARTRAGLNDDRVDELLRAVGRGKFGDTVERRAVEAMVEALDERQWDVQDRVDAGEASVADHLRAFAAARAAAATVFAADADARTAALEALYEANAAANDLNELRQSVDPILA